MKITIALLFLGLIVLAVAEPHLKGNPQQDQMGQDDVVQHDKDNKKDVLNDENELQVKRARKYHTFRLCEHKSGTIKCPGRRRIKVEYANYGRTDCGSVCPHQSFHTTNCHSSSASIRSKCHNKNSCHLYASNSVYGDPCRGTYKYIEVKYWCSWYMGW